jgi:hypothetical protein
LSEPVIDVSELPWRVARRLRTFIRLEITTVNGAMAGGISL